MLALLKKHPYALIFGATNIFFSAPGQTIIISLFVAPIFQDLNLSISKFAAIYSLATIGGSIGLNGVGILLDKVSELKTIIIINAGMAIGCTFIATSHSIYTLFIGFFIIRLFGQGGFGLASSTILARSFEKNRGTALGIMTLGFPISEMVYPCLAILGISLYGWRVTYLLFAGSYLMISIPLLMFCIKKAKFTKQIFEDEKIQASATQHKHLIQNKTLQQAIKDKVFYIVLIGFCTPPLLMTGLFFHQSTLFQNNAWPIEMAAIGITFYAITKAILSVIIGPIIDKKGPLVSFSIFIILLGVGTLIAANGGHITWIFVYFGLMGAALGMSSPVMNVIWPNLYGIQHLGSIKGVVGMFRNGLTALAPLPIALALDSGVSLQGLLMVTGSFVLCIASFPFIAYRLSPSINYAGK